MLDETLSAAFNDDAEGYFATHRAAQAIFVNGTKKLESTNSVGINMKRLLSNMCEYGKQHWTYEPGNEEQWESYLTGRGTRTGCIQLARTFADMAQALGRVAATIHAQSQVGRDSAIYAKARHEVFDYATYHPKETEEETIRINQYFETYGGTRGSHGDWYRMISKRVADFTGKFGDHRNGGRWSFGNHSVAVVGGQVYDPSFNKSGFLYSLEKMNTEYVDWWVREESAKGVFNRKRWVDTKGLKAPLYEYYIPAVKGQDAWLCGLIAAVEEVPSQYGMSFDHHLSANSRM